MAVLGPSAIPRTLVARVPPVVLAASAETPVAVLSSTPLFTSASVPTAVFSVPVVLSNKRYRANCGIGIRVVESQRSSAYTSIEVAGGIAKERIPTKACISSAGVRS